MDQHYQILDAFARSLELPESWRHPSLFALQLINVGWHVKIGVEMKETRMHGERFWCRVIEVQNTTQYTVEVNQDLLCTSFHGVRDKDRLRIQRKHVFGILYPSGRVLWDARG
jgi:hypothetical protein